MTQQELADKISALAEDALEQSTNRQHEGYILGLLASASHKDEMLARLREGVFRVWREIMDEQDIDTGRRW